MPLPTLISSLSSYPTSAIFASCLSSHLESLKSELLDQDGNVQDLAIDQISPSELLEYLDKIEDIQVLETVIDTLKKTAPLGR